MRVCNNSRSLGRQHNRVGFTHHHHTSSAFHSNKRDFIARNGRQTRRVAPTDVGVPKAWEVFEERLLYKKFLALSEVIRQPLVAARPGQFVRATQRDHQSFTRV